MAITIVEGTEHKEEDFELLFDSMEPLWDMEDRHFWHESRNHWIIQAVQSIAQLPAQAKFLEIGCGSGAVSRALQNRGIQVTGVDTAKALIEKANQRCPDGRFIVGDLTQMNSEDLGGPFDALGFFDVLEHLDQPEELLSSAIQHLKPGAAVFATVPANQEAYSVVDYISGHKKRYDLGELSQLLARCGVTEVVEYGIFRVLFGIQKIRSAQQNKKVHSYQDLTLEQKRDIALTFTDVPCFPINWALGMICHLERIFFSLAANKQGGSQIAIGRVP